MRKKFIVRAFKYPYQGYNKAKCTDSIIAALFWTFVYSIMYSGVDLNMRKKGCKL